MKTEIMASAARDGSREINFSPSQAGVILLAGDNGSGKTTLLHSIERGCGARNAQGVAVAMLPQDFRLPSFTRVHSLLSLFRSRGAPSVDKLLSITALQEDRSKRVRQLSGGMKRRLGVGLCLAQGADVLLLDEPCAGLDPTQRDRLAQVLHIVGEHSLVVMSTHHLAEFAAVSDRIIILDKQRVRFDGLAEEFLSYDPHNDAHGAYRAVMAGREDTR